MTRLDRESLTDFNHILTVVRGPVIGTLVGCLLFSILLAVAGHDPVRVWVDFAVGGWGSSEAVLEALVVATPILFCAQAAALPARAGLTNIGGEGQLLLGAIGATAVVASAAWLPWPFLIPTMILASAFCAAVWGLIPALLRNRFGSSETVVSLLQNFVAALLVLYLIHGPWRDPASAGWPQTAAFPPAAVLPVFGASRVHVLLPVGVLAGAVLAYLGHRTFWGMEARVLAASPQTARYLGIRSSAYVLITMAIGGALAGLAGLGEVSVVQGRLRDGLSPGFGYTGFLVAWMCGNRFLAIPPVAIALGGLVAAADSLQVVSALPAGTIDMLQGAILVAVLAVQSHFARESRYTVSATSRMSASDG